MGITGECVIRTPLFFWVQAGVEVGIPSPLVLRKVFEVDELGPDFMFWGCFGWGRGRVGFVKYGTFGS